MSDDKKILHKALGPGGPKCHCCGVSQRHRKTFDRMVKRSIRHRLRQKIRNTNSSLYY